MRPTPVDIAAGAGGTRPLTPAELRGALRHGITSFLALFNLWRLLQFGAASNKKGAALFGVSYSTFAAWTAGDHFPPHRYRDAIARVTGIACVHLEGARHDEELRVARIARRAAKTECSITASEGLMSRIKTIKIEDDVMSVLKISEITGNTLKLPPQQLDRDTYTRVDKVLRAAGGKWNRRLGAHEFPSPDTSFEEHPMEWQIGHLVRNQSLGKTGVITHYSRLNGAPQWVVTCDDYPDENADFPEIPYFAMRGVEPDVAGWRRMPPPIEPMLAATAAAATAAENQRCRRIARGCLDYPWPALAVYADPENEEGAPQRDAFRLGVTVVHDIMTTAPEVDPRVTEIEALGAAADARDRAAWKAVKRAPLGALPTENGGSSDG